jgi:uncharacterized membrane protein YidH (DUF202 family)
MSALFAAIGRYDGLALSLIGIAILLLGGLRFVRTSRDIDSPEPRAAGMRIELLLSGALAVLAAVLVAYLLLG